MVKSFNHVESMFMSCQKQPHNTNADALSWFRMFKFLEILCNPSFFLLKLYITVQLYVLDGKAICFSKSYRNLTFIPLRWRGTMKIFRLIFHCFLIEFSTFVYISFIQLFTYYMCIVPKLDLCFPGLFESCSLYAQTILVWRVPN